MFQRKQRPESRNYKKCKTTLWIKKSALFFKEMTLTSFGPFRPPGDRIGARFEGNGT